MKVKDLIKELQQMNPESELIMQKDSEGNGYSPLSGADGNAVYIADSTWSGEVYDTKWSAEDADMEEEEWEEIKSKPGCVVLYPIN